MAVTLGAGYIFGGANPLFDGLGVTNGLTLLIAISNMISATVAAATLFFLMSARNDWLKPKSNDVALELSLSLKHWAKTQEQVILAIYKGCYDGFELRSDSVTPHYESLTYLNTVETEAWQRLLLLIEKNEFYSSGNTDPLYETIKNIREYTKTDMLVFINLVEKIDSTHELEEIVRKKNKLVDELDNTIEKLLAKLSVRN